MYTLRKLLSEPCSSRYARQISALYHRRAFSSAGPRGSPPSPPSSGEDHPPPSPPACYVSTSHDIWWNLSYEDYLLRNTPRDSPVLFLYRNEPCVVIGRNQNPWKESTPRLLREWGIPLVRRRSGGGTVYHDMGNTNFSIILPRLSFTRRHGAELAARAVREGLGVQECTVNDRNDVIIRPSSGTGDLKVSGSAYKIIQHRAYHHGTMLISSDLTTLGKAIRSSSPGIETKGIPSYRSPVTTISEYRPSHRSSPFTHTDFVREIIKEFSRIYAPSGKEVGTVVVNPTEVQEKKVKDGVEELQSWEWTYGQSPEFTNVFEGQFVFGTIAVSLACRHALLTSLTLHLTPARSLDDDAAAQIQKELDALALSLIGKQYESLLGAEDSLAPLSNDPPARELVIQVIEWLRRTM